MTDNAEKNQKQWLPPEKRKWLVLLAAVAAAAVCVVVFWLAPMLRAPEPVSRPEASATPTASLLPSPSAKPKPTSTQKQILPELAELYAQNNDLAGWIKIPDTVVDYPVMYTPEDGEFYLYRTFEKQEDPTKEGCLFIDKHNTLEPRDDNLLIHGHNMKNGSMFHTLLDYLDEAFYKEHPVIEFSTLYSADRYEIVSVFLSKVYNKDDNVFKFYQFYDAKTKEEFDGFLTNIKQLELYPTGITPEYGDELITLSTCEYSQDDGRIAVVARKIK